MITVFGAGGFIGSHLARRLRRQDVDHRALGRGEELPGKHLGHAIYCIGLTSDFRTKPMETVDAHVCKLQEVLRDCKFDSFLYLSSTRLYGHTAGLAREDDEIHMIPSNPDDLYNISKVMGEALLHAHGRKYRQTVRIARLSNVYGGDYNSGNFLDAILREAVFTGKIQLRTSLDSEKDYVSINDVVDALLKIAISGKHTIYNIASGVNVSNRELMEKISELTGCHIEVDPAAKPIKFPRIHIERMRTEFDNTPSSILQDLGKLVGLYEGRRGAG